MKSLRLVITGRVQAVGFRDWLIAEADARLLSGWVRNVGNNKVEALIAGPAEAVDACQQLCWQGPPLAHVTHVTATEAPAPERPGFHRRSSVA